MAIPMMNWPLLSKRWTKLRTLASLRYTRRGFSLSANAFYRMGSVHRFVSGVDRCDAQGMVASPSRSPAGPSLPFLLATFPWSLIGFNDSSRLSVTKAIRMGSR
jgi:hypothetical protein